MLWQFGKLIGVVLVCAVFALWSPGGDITKTPKFWRDEAIPFAIARSFAEQGIFDVAVAPGVASGVPYLTHATGFPVTGILAGVFKIFGASVFVARSVMLLWIAITLGSIFFVARSFFGSRAGIAAVLLVGTFSSFYANGRTVTGEIPGLMFLLWAILFIYKKEHFIFGGFLLALAAVTKPSIYLLLFPAIAIEFFIAHRSHWFRNLLRIAIGALPVICFWLWIIVPEPFMVSSWQKMFSLYSNPFNDSALISRFPEELFAFLFHPTILYFSAITLIILLAAWKRVFSELELRFVHFALIYGVFAIVYVLRSPGWFRFLIAYQVLVLILLAPAFFGWLRIRRAHAYFLIFVFIIVQTITYFFSAHIPSGGMSIESGNILRAELLKDQSVTLGFINLPTVAPLVDSRRVFQIGEIGGDDTYGINPLSYGSDHLPTYVFSYNNLYTGYEDVLARYYEPTQVTILKGVITYKRR